MKRGLLLIVIVVLLAAQPILFSYGQCLEDCLGARIDEVVQPLIDSEERVGIVVGVINKQGIRTFSYGETVMDSGNEPDGETIFEIGSVTKTFTTLLLADMVEKDVLELEDPVENFLPSSVNVPSFNGTKITLLDLATHTSGLPPMPTNFNPEDELNPYADYTAELLYEFLSGYSLEREPSTEYQYSNVGMALLGHVLALETGIDYETLVTDRICNSLGMDDTRISLSAEQEQRLASGYFGEFDPWLPGYKHELVPHWDFDVFSPAGALRSTALDLIVYVSANLGLIETDLSSAIELTHTVRRETTSQNMEICLGWHTLDYEGAEIIMHHGATYGFNSDILFIKEESVGVVLLSNTYVYESNSIDDAGLEILQILRECQRPVANFTWTPSKPKVSESVAFDASSSTPNVGEIVSYEWNFGDDSYDSSEMVSHTYTSSGTYTVTLNVTDSEGLWDIEQKQLQVVQPHGPEAEFTATPDTALVGDSIKFDASASLPGWNGTHKMPITEYRWNFGGGINITTSTPIMYYSFISSGIYYVTLTVYALGATPETDTISSKVTIISVPVGGYSIPIEGYTTTKPLTLYLAIIAILTVSFTIVKRRKKQQS